MIISGIICGALALVIVTMIARPHFLLVKQTAQNISLDELLPIDTDSLELHRERYIQVLRDLELDWKTEKISPDDYERTKAPLERELSAVLKALKQRS